MPIVFKTVFNFYSFGYLLHSVDSVLAVVYTSLSIFKKMVHITKFVSSRPVITGLIIFIVLYILYRVAVKAISAILLKRKQTELHINSVLKFWRYGYWSLALLLIMPSFSGSFAAIGLSAAFLGMLLGWSLQRPVTGLAAWLMIMLKRPFKVGDRVIIANVVGDVRDISPMYVTLNQVGGTVSGDDPSGRGVLIPTAILFDQLVFNYTLENEFILDEVSIRITYDSDWDIAERILTDAALEITQNAKQSGCNPPYVRANFYESGILMQVRYYVLPVQREKIATDITKRIYCAFKSTPQVRFCYPHTELVQSN